MKSTLRQDGLIHVNSLGGRGRARCGAVAPEYGFLNLSNNGVGITCPDCQDRTGARVFCGMSCPQCFEHGWLALTPDEVERGAWTCGRCGHAAAARDFIYVTA